MDDQPTAWEDINPTMGLARQEERDSRSLGRLDSAEVFRNELTACLALVAPVGMNEEAKRDWLTVAWATLGHIPPSILKIGCQAARETCDHPSKVVPAIIAATKEMMSWGKNTSDYVPLQITADPNYVTPEEAAKILAEFGLKPSSIS